LGGGHHRHPSQQCHLFILPHPLGSTAHSNCWEQYFISVYSSISSLLTFIFSLWIILWHIRFSLVTWSMHHIAFP
jgi:hypothetical protein